MRPMKSFLLINIMRISGLNRLILCGVLLAGKFNDDLRLGNKDFAKIGGVCPQELMLMEMQFLHDVEFNLNVSTNLFLNYLSQLLK